MGRNQTSAPSDWLAVAESDLRYAEAGFRASGLAAPTCFISQQVAEKALKAVLVARRGVVPRIHDLVKPLELCVDEEPSLTNIAEDTKYLTRFYNEARYPSHLREDLTKKDAVGALEASHRVVAAVTKVLQ